MPALLVGPDSTCPLLVVEVFAGGVSAEFVVLGVPRTMLSLVMAPLTIVCVSVYGVVVTALFFV